MADIKINVKTEGGEEALNSIAGIKKQIKELRSQALAVGEGGKGFKDLTKQANELQDSLDDLKDSAKSLQGTGIEKLKSSFGLLTESFKNADFGKLKTALSGVGSAMKAIPIFLIVEGIMYLVENFEKLSKGSGFLAKALQFVGSIISKVTEGITWLLDKLGLVNAELDKQSERLTESAENSKKAIDKQNTSYDQQIAILKANGKSTVELEVSKQNAIIATNKALVEQAITFVKSGGELSKAQKETLDAQLAAIKQASVDKEVVIATAETASAEKRKKAGEEYAANKKKADEKAAKEELDTWNKTIEIRMANSDAQEKRAEQDRKDIADKRIADEKAMYDEMNASNLASMEEDRQNYLNSEEGKLEIAKIAADKKKAISDAEDKAAQDKFKKQVEDINKYTQAIGSALNSVIGVFQAISDLNKQEAEQDTKEKQAVLDTQVGALNDARDAELEKEGLTAEQKKAINYKYAMQEYELKIQEYNRSTEVKKKAFEQDKKLKIAQAVISTITGAVSAFTGAMELGPIAGPIVGALLAAAVVATGAVQIAAINATKFDAGSAPSPPKISPPSNTGIGGGEGGMGGPQQGPQLYKAGQGDINTGAGGPNGERKGQPQKVYVVSQEVTSSQNMDAVIERRSSF